MNAHEEHHHDGATAKPHMHDVEAHVTAVENDLEYYRTKRLEPRVLYLARRGIVTLTDLLRAKPDGIAPVASAGDLESRIRALEDALDDYVRGIGLVTSDLVKVDTVIEDTRKERGDYDESFRIAKRHHEGSLAERVEALERDLSEYRTLLEAFTRALIDKGLVDAADLDHRRVALVTPGPWNGARIVARAWVDPEFKARLIEQGREAVRDLGIPPGRLGKLGVVENTDTVHHVVVCTLCSCYPHDLLGDTPWWYRQDIYKQRIVRDPRATLAELFGLELPSEMTIVVHDSTSDVRYMVLPRKPPGTEGLSDAALAALVTRESLIGAGEPLRPRT